jgi:hypothetical protein
MKAYFFALAAGLSACTAAANAGGFDIQIDNFTADGIAEVVMKVTNNTGRDASNVFIDCVFMDKNQKAIDIGKALISSIPSGGHAYEKAAIPRSDGVQYASCSVVRSN